jgi:23S rRNA (cytosine1962-C5)-methyltransferase
MRPDVKPYEGDADGGMKAMTAIVKLAPGRHKRIKAGHPWVYSNEISRADLPDGLEPGALVTIVGDNGEAYGTAIYNPHSLLAARIVDRDGGGELDVEFLTGRLRRALDIRERLFDAPYYRLVHAEADGLPGLIIDRYGDAAAVQFNSAGMDRRRDAVLAALDEIIEVKTIVLRNDGAGRALEGLTREVTTVRGDGAATIWLRENGADFATSLESGQKTGWFFDQRDSRAFLARLAKGARVADVYAYGGGFGIQALCAGASSAILIDSSQRALDGAAESAQRNNVAQNCQFVKADAFKEMQRQPEGEYDIVIADPPAFVKSRKDLRAGCRAYRKMTRLAARLVAPGGILFVASCSHNVAPDLFGECVRKGLADARRSGRILRQAGASADHPIHPHLPESAYLKSLTLLLD